MGGGGQPPAISLGGQTAARGLSLTAAGQSELANFDVRDNPWFQCEPGTLPDILDGTQQIFREDGALIFRYEILEIERTVHLGLSDHPVGTAPSHLGHSIGRFDGGTLVVDTSLFTPATWGIGAGVPSSDQKHVVERYTLTNNGRRLEVETLFEDPVYLSEPMEMATTFFLDAGYPWQNYNCDAQASRRHLDVE